MIHDVLNSSDAASLPLPDEQILRLTEAMIFSGTAPVSTRSILNFLLEHDLIPSGTEDVGSFVNTLMVMLQARYADHGMYPVEVAGGWQFRTAPDIAPLLTKILPRPRRLARAAMETLAIIAYHQPCTRAEIEEIRGVSLNPNVLDALIEESLIAPRGRKEVPGRPVLWGTTPDFLRHFGLKALSELPRREELMMDMPEGPASREEASPPSVQAETDKQAEGAETA
jgi:segregation and condensation protein B